MTAWSPQRDFDALLELLAGELLAAPAPEVDAEFVETGRDRADAAEEIRRLLDRAGVPTPAEPNPPAWQNGSMEIGRWH